MDHYSYDDFLLMKKEDLFCDVVVIKCDDNKTFAAHRLVLAAASPYFRAMFMTSGMLESSQDTVHLRGIDSQSFNYLINYDASVSTNTQLDVQTLANVLTAANMLCFEDIESACIDKLRTNLNVTNCVDVLRLAERLNCQELQVEVTSFIIKHFQLLTMQASFANITSVQLETVLSSDALGVTSESQGYKAVMKWVKFEPDQRQKHLPRLLRHIRLVLLSRKFLIDVVMREPLIMDDNECRNLVLKTLDHFLLPERRTINTCDGVEPHSSERLREKTLFVIGGQGNRHALNIVETYDFIEDKWTIAAPLKKARRNVAVVALEGTLYSIAGIGAENNDLVSVEKYTIENDQWQCVASLSKCQGVVSAAVIDGWIYVAGGSRGNKTLKFTERYDSITDQWTAVPSMRLQRSHFGMTSLGEKVYAIGGYSGISEMEHCEYFDPVFLTWRDITCMNKSRRNHAVITHNSCIYAIGGSNIVTGPLNSIERYSPDLNMWLVIRSCSSIRPGMDACLYSRPGTESHDLYLVGGCDMNEHEQSEIKILSLKSPDYSIKKFSDMKEKRIFAAAIML
eukprot:gene5322-5991_t